MALFALRRADPVPAGGLFAAGTMWKSVLIGLVTLSAQRHVVGAKIAFKDKRGTLGTRRTNDLGVSTKVTVSVETVGTIFTKDFIATIALHRAADPTRRFMAACAMRVGLSIALIFAVALVA